MFPIENTSTVNRQYCKALDKTGRAVARPQSVDKAPNRQNEFCNGLGLSIVFLFGQNISIRKYKAESPARHFDLQQKTEPAVPMYADGPVFLVFGAFLTSDSFVEKSFFDKTAGVLLHARLVFMILLQLLTQNYLNSVDNCTDGLQGF